MSSYKLIYFNFKARAEVSRLMFAIAGVKYQDVRFERDKWSENYKQDAPFGQLPILEVDGEAICQSRTIEGYLARKFGLAGNGDLEQAKASMVNDCLEDFRAPYRNIYYETDEKKKAEMRDVYRSTTMITHLGGFHNLLRQNNDGDGYFIGDKMTYADVAFYHHSSMLPVMSGVKVDWDKWPKLKSVRDKVETHPKVAEWIAKRPVTEL